MSDRVDGGSACLFYHPNSQFGHYDITRVLIEIEGTKKQARRRRFGILKVSLLPRFFSSFLMLRKCTSEHLHILLLLSFHRQAEYPTNSFLLFFFLRAPQIVRTTYVLPSLPLLS